MPVEPLAPGLAALSAGLEQIAGGGSAVDALRAVAETSRVSTGADLVVVRVAEGGGLRARMVAGAPSLAAELEGSTLAGDPPAEEIVEIGLLPADARALADRVRADAVLVLPVRVQGAVAGSLELWRSGASFDEGERDVARLVAAHAGAMLHALAPNGTDRVAGGIELAADGLAAGADDERVAARVARLAADATGAVGCVLWRDGELELEVIARTSGADAEIVRGHAEAAVRMRTGSGPDRAGTLQVFTVPLGEPVFGAIQLLFASGRRPEPVDLESFAGFARRAAQALRAGERMGEVRRELERTRDVLSVVGQATAQLSLSHTLETAVARVPALLGLRSAGLYLRENGRLEAAASRDVAGPHAVVAERLLELALGPFRARGIVASSDAAEDRHLAPVRAALTEAGIEAAHAVPLVAHGDVIGLLAVYPPRGRVLTEDQSWLLAALAGQMAVAVQNAQLHEEAKLLSVERERALGAERAAARRLSALYEISRSFAQSLSLDRTLDAVGRTLLELLDVDVAAIRLPDERNESLVAQAVHVSSPQLQPALDGIFGVPDVVVPSSARRRLAAGLPVRLDPSVAEELGRAHGLLAPFLEGGASGAVIPMATPSELLATLTLLSLDPRRPITDETLDTALSVAVQAALAVDNARLYQQEKAFSDSMLRSLLPRTRPQIPGLELGAVYEASALVGVGGDVYDYLQTADDRLAIVLGDVTGHGIDAAADMAMAKFVFRSLVRLYPEPSAFLTAANDVVVEEIGAGKFITMLYLTIDLGRGEVACASGGHPQPRLIRADGRVESLAVSGLVLGIESDEQYEELRTTFEPGAAVVLYTDGLIEARRAGEQYGERRLDSLLAEQWSLPAQQLADAVLEDCRQFVGGDLRDDCAIVVVRRR